MKKERAVLSDGSVQAITGSSSTTVPREVAPEVFLPQRAASWHSYLQHWTCVTALLLTDAAALTTGFAIALLIRVQILPVMFNVFPENLPENLMLNLSWAPVVYTLCFIYEGLYRIRRAFWQELGSILKASTLALIIILAVVSLAKMSAEVSRTVIVLTYLVCLLTIPAYRYAAKIALAKMGVWRRRVLVLGAGKTGELVAQALTRENYQGYDVVGFLDDNPARKHGVRANGGYFPVLGGFGDTERLMEKRGVRHLFVAAPGMESQKLVELINRLQRRAASVTVIPDLIGIPVMDVEADYSFNEQILSLRIKNNLANPWNMFIKRIFDLVVGSTVLTLVSPLVSVIALAVKLDSPGPVIFAHRRIGRGGKVFWCYKFRTMYLNNQEILKEHLDADPEAKREWTTYAKLKNHDPRVTRIGRLLREFSLDELLQIFNVLKGEMSLVGPRPYLVQERLQLGEHSHSILLARPGITGLWQVQGRNELTFQDRILLEEWYVRNWSIWLDVTLLFRTIPILLGRRGAY